LDITWKKEYPKGEAIVEEVSYQATVRCRAGALLVSPEGDGSYPAVICMHCGNAIKTQFLEEVVELAGQGVISLLIHSPFDTGCDIDIAGGRGRQGYIDTVIFIRCAGVGEG
jgi:hypothetical protein